MGDEEVSELNSSRYIFKIGSLLKPLIIFVFTILLFYTGKVQAQGINPIINEGTNVNLSDNLKLVRVAINDSSFRSFVYNQVSIIATSEFTLYDKNTGKQIAKFKPNEVARVKFASGKFNVSVNNKLVAKNIDGTLIFNCSKGFIGVENLKRNGRQALYHGIFELAPRNDSQFYLINVIDLEDYLKGVVPNEMPIRFGLEALKAQAVAARNYVLMPRAKYYKEFDVDDSVSSQVYFGANSETDLSNRAIRETEGLVALYNWNLILAQYCSTAGGYTENYENAFSDPKTKAFPSKQKPFLMGYPDMYTVAPLNREEEARLFYMGYPDSYDIKSPYYRWKKEFSADELTNVLKKTLVEQSKTGFVKPEFKQGNNFDEIRDIVVRQRGVSGKVMEVDIITDKQTYHVYKELVVRRIFEKNGISLPSANIVFENLFDTNKKLNKVIIYGGGFGHGVGMSQYGAGFMATSLHKPFDKILKRYYTGITISTVPIILSSNDSQKIVTLAFFAPTNKANVVIDNKYNIKEFSAIINGSHAAFELANGVVQTHRVCKIDISSYIRQGKNTITFYFPEKEKNKGIRVYIELVEKDESRYNF